LDHYCAIFSPSLTDLERDRRIALNGYLEGLDRSAFEIRQQQVLSGHLWGVEARDWNRRNARLKNRLAEYDSIAAEPEAALREFAVRYVALRVNQPPPPYLSPAWTLSQQGPFWRVWELTTSSARNLPAAVCRTATNCTWSGQAANLY